MFFPWSWSFIKGKFSEKKCFCAHSWQISHPHSWIKIVYKSTHDITSIYIYIYYRLEYCESISCMTNCLTCNYTMVIKIITLIYHGRQVFLLQFSTFLKNNIKIIIKLLFFLYKFQHFSKISTFFQKFQHFSKISILNFSKISILNFSKISILNFSTFTIKIPL